MVWEHVNRQWLEETMYVFLSKWLYLWDLEEQRGREFKVIMRREGENPQTKGTFIGCHTTIQSQTKFLEHPFLLSLTVTLPKSVKVVHESKKDKSDISRVKVVVQFSHLFKK